MRPTPIAAPSSPAGVRRRPSAHGQPVPGGRLAVAVLVLVLGAGGLTSGDVAPASSSVPSSTPSSRAGTGPRATRPFLAYVTVIYVNVRGAYEERGTIWTADLDGSNRRRLVAGNLPDISPDGPWIAFRDNNSRLRVVASGGGTPRLLDRRPVGWGAFAWAPDSRRLGVEIGRSLIVVDIQTGRRVTIDRAKWFLGFSFSPSVREIAWAPKMGELTPTLGGYDIYRASIKGGSVRRLTHDRGSY